MVTGQYLLLMSAICWIIWYDILCLLGCALKGLPQDFGGKVDYSSRQIAEYIVGSISNNVPEPLSLIAEMEVLSHGVEMTSSQGEGVDEDGISDPTPECRRILNNWLSKCVFKS